MFSVDNAYSNPWASLLCMPPPARAQSPVSCHVVSARLQVNFPVCGHSQTQLPGPGTTAICWALTGLLLGTAAPCGCHSAVSCRAVDVLGACGPRGGWNGSGGYVGA